MEIDTETVLKIARLSRIRITDSDSTDIQKLGENAERFYDKYLSVKVGVDSFEKVFNEVIDSGQR